MAQKLDEPQDRWGFLKALGTVMAGFVAEKVEDAVVGSGPKLLRPPGALEEFAFLTACTRCDKCLPACPQDALLKAPGTARMALGTPYLAPRSMPCFLCTELPCIPACPEGALVWPKRTLRGAEVEGPRAVRMGTAVVTEDRCVTWSQEESPAQVCRTCVDRCPYPDEAIRMVEAAEGGPAHPKVDVETCTGCGLCEFGCPAPRSAITVEPRR
jgi:MauM/NapG family ferredoxin protein